MGSSSCHFCPHGKKSQVLDAVLISCACYLSSLCVFQHTLSSAENVRNAFNHSVLIPVMAYCCCFMYSVMPLSPNNHVIFPCSKRPAPGRASPYLIKFLMDFFMSSWVHLLGSFKTTFLDGSKSLYDNIASFHFNPFIKYIIIVVVIE